MKNTIRFLGIIAFAAIIGFSIAACGGDDDSPGPGPGPDTGPYVPGPDPVPKITMTTTVSGPTCIYLLGTGSAAIDWGDGDSEEITLTPSDVFNDLWDYDFSHTYASDAVKTITVTGAVTGFDRNSAGNASALNVSGCPGLKFLGCFCEDLTELDLSKNTALEWLNCEDNHLSALDLSKNTILEVLYCDGNQLESLNITGNTKLDYVECQFNNLGLDALIAVFDSLPPKVSPGDGDVCVSENPGIYETGYAAAKAAAEAKYWTVVDY